MLFFELWPVARLDVGFKHRAASPQLYYKCEGRCKQQGKGCNSCLDTVSQAFCVVSVKLQDVCASTSHAILHL